MKIKQYAANKFYRNTIFAFNRSQITGQWTSVYQIKSFSIPVPAQVQILRIKPINVMHTVSLKAEPSLN